jgi:hypothetical protein
MTSCNTLQMALLYSPYQLNLIASSMKKACGPLTTPRVELAMAHPRQHTYPRIINHQHDETNARRGPVSVKSDVEIYT